VRVQEIVDAGGREVLLNLASVPYIDSEGLGAMAAAVSALRRNAGTLRLLNPSPWARELLRITALNSVMESFDSEVSAIQSMLTHQRPRPLTEEPRDDEDHPGADHPLDQDDDPVRRRALQSALMQSLCVAVSSKLLQRGREDIRHDRRAECLSDVPRRQGHQPSER
jgi:anti-anti-sigma regulatory factor